MSGAPHVYVKGVSRDRQKKKKIIVGGWCGERVKAVRCGERCRWSR